MDPERPKNTVEEVALPKQPEGPSREVPATPEITPEQRKESEKAATERITEIMEQLSVPDNIPSTKTATSSPLVASEGSMNLSVDPDAVKSFFLDQGLSEEQIAVFKIKFGKLHWSNKVTRFLASFLPGRLREITRIQSLKGNTLKFFTNNLDSIYDMGDAELIARDTIHHLMHFVQGKRPEKRLNIFFHYLTHLIPMSLYTPPHETEARNLANEADLGSGPLANMVQFSSNREQRNNRLKIKV